MKLDILKCHGTSNDFVLIDEISNDYNIKEEDRKALALKLCSREGIIGADGILFVQKSSICDGKMRIFNADGSEAEMCGNGLRCVGRYVMELLNKDFITIETLNAKYDVKKVKDIYSGIYTVEIEINTVNFNVKSLPMNHNDDTFMFSKIKDLSEDLEFTAVSITNPHAVTFVKKFDNNKIVRIGYKANNLKTVFPKGVNVNFVRELSIGNIYVKTYERGVGITKSCGTGMTASTVVYCLKNSSLYGSELNIYNDGGMIKCFVQKDDKDNYKVRFIGNATFVFKTSVDTDLLFKKEKQNLSIHSFEDEINTYNKFMDNVKMTVEK